MHLSENADATANSLYVFNNGNNNISNGEYVVNIDRSKSLLTTTHNTGINAGVGIGAPNKTIYTVIVIMLHLLVVVLLMLLLLMDRIQRLIQVDQEHGK